MGKIKCKKLVFYKKTESSLKTNGGSRFLFEGAKKCSKEYLIYINTNY